MDISQNFLAFSEYMNFKTVTKLSSKRLAALNHKAKIGTSTGQGQQEVICSTICKMLTQA